MLTTLLNAPLPRGFENLATSLKLDPELINPSKNQSYLIIPHLILEH